MKKGRLFIGILAAAFLSIPSAEAQPTLLSFAGAIDNVSAEQVLLSGEPEGEAPDNGWNYKLSIGGTGSWSYANDFVIGVTGGTTLQLGALIDGAAEWREDKHIWSTTLKVNESVVRTAQVTRLVPSQDTAALESLYRYVWMPSVGPYFSASAATKLFDGFLVFAQDYEVTRLRADGSVISGPGIKPGLQSITLTQPFQPTVLKTSAGAFFTASDDETLKLTGRAGLGGQMIFASSSFLVDSLDAANQTIILREIEEQIAQFGALVRADGTGAINENLSWTAGAEAFYPIVDDTNYDYPSNDLERLHLQLDGKISAKINKWASIDYGLALRRLPSLQQNQQWQILSNVLLSTSFDVVD